MSEIFEQHLQELDRTSKPRLRAVIREMDCIGCTKCIAACPVDAILGASKSMHTVIAGECTGCELCVTPCPVDCIDMIVIADSEKQDAAYFQPRYQAHKQRLLQESLEQRSSAKKARTHMKNSSEKLDYIQAALSRVKAKKISK